LSIQLSIKPLHQFGVRISVYLAKTVLYSCQGVSLMREKGMVATDMGEGAVVLLLANSTPSGMYRKTGLTMPSSPVSRATASHVCPDGVCRPCASVGSDTSRTQLS